MKRLLAIVVCLGLLSAMLVLAGCGKKTSTIKTSEGEVSVEEGEGKVTYRSEEGEVTYESSEKVPTEEDLGAPIYPGSEYVEGSGSKVTGTSEGQKVSTAEAQFTTEDAIDKVISWYRDKLGAPMYENTDPREASWMMSSESYLVTVSVSEEEEKTTISIARISGMK